MNELQKKLLELLKEIDSLCRSKGIVYYASGGTVLGAVRHKGFIPWDDDIDICITASEFEKFKEAFNEIRPKNRELSCIENNEGYMSTVCRYVDLKSTYFTKYNISGASAGGVFVDIFVMDKIDGNATSVAAYRNRLNIYADALMPFYHYSFRNDEDYIDEYKEYTKDVICLGEKEAKEKQRMLLHNCTNAEGNYYIVRWGTMPTVFPKKMFGKAKHLKFEDTLVPVPNETEEYLTALYGIGWMDAPKNIEAQGHLVLKDLDKPYEYYKKTIDEWGDIEKLKDKGEKAKIALIESAKYERVAKTEAMHKIGEYLIEDLHRKEIEEMNEGYAQMRNPKDKYKEYEKYIKYQCSTEFSGNTVHRNAYRYNNPFCVEISEEKRAEILKVLLINDEYKECETLIRVFSCRKNSEMLIKAISNYKKVSNVINAFYLGEYEKSLQALFSIDNEIRNNSARLFYIENTIEYITRGKYPVDVSEVEKIIGHTTHDEYLFKLIGDLKYLKNKNDANQDYERALEKINNVFDVKEIESKLKKTLSEHTPSKKEISSEEGNNRLILLKEMDDACKSRGISYSLDVTDYNIMSITSRFRDEYNSPKILMKTSDAIRFIEMVNKTKDRTIEYPTINNGLKTYEFKYAIAEYVEYDLLNKTRGLFGIEIQLADSEYNKILPDKYIDRLYRKTKKIIKESKKDSLRYQFAIVVYKLMGGDAKGEQILKKRMYNEDREPNNQSAKKEIFIYNDIISVDIHESLPWLTTADITRLNLKTQTEPGLKIIANTTPASMLLNTLIEKVDLEEIKCYKKEKKKAQSYDSDYNNLWKKIVDMNR